MKIAAGTKNPSKLKGIKNAYQKLLKVDVDVIGVQVPTGVSHQPSTFNEVIEGAINRAKYSIEKVKEAEQGVGVEAGFIYVKNKVFDVQVAAIIDRDNNITLGLSPAFQIPPKFVRRIFSEGVELEVVVDNYFRTRSIGEKGGFISILTKGLVSRDELTELAVIMALIPRIWKELYST